MSDQVKDRPVLPIDPRIRARRVEVTRTEGRRRLKVLLVGLGVVAGLAGAVGVTRSPLLDVDRIQLVGASHTSRAEVLKAARLDGRPQMIDIDSPAVVRRLRSLPWIRTAAIERQWPGTVVLRITERNPVAVIADKANWMLVDGTGRYLELVDAPPTGLPQISGAARPSGPGSSMPVDLVPVAAMMRDLPGEVAPLAAQVVIADNAIELHSDAHSPVVKLGPPVEIEAKIRALRAVLIGANMDRVKVIDVRVPTAPVLTRG